MCERSRYFLFLVFFYVDVIKGFNKINLRGKEFIERIMLGDRLSIVVGKLGW